MGQEVRTGPVELSPVFYGRNSTKSLRGPVEGYLFLPLRHTTQQPQPTNNAAPPLPATRRGRGRAPPPWPPTPLSAPPPLRPHRWPSPALVAAAGRPQEGTLNIAFSACIACTEGVSPSPNQTSTAPLTLAGGVVFPTVAGDVAAAAAPTIAAAAGVDPSADTRPNGQAGPGQSGGEEVVEAEGDDGDAGEEGERVDDERGTVGVYGLEYEKQER